MMNQKKTPKTGMIKYLLILPLISAFVISSNAESMLNSDGQAINVQTPPPSPPPIIEGDEGHVSMVVERMPQYPGGDEELFKYLATNIKYPSDAKEQNIEGRVICQFIINRDGSVSEVVVVRSITPSLDAEAVRVISAMPNWTPGEQRAQTVRVKYTLPINFKLEGKEKIEKTTEN